MRGNRLVQHTLAVLLCGMAAGLNIDQAFRADSDWWLLLRAALVAANVGCVVLLCHSYQTWMLAKGRLEGFLEFKALIDKERERKSQAPFN